MDKMYVKFFKFQVTQTAFKNRSNTLNKVRGTQMVPVLWIDSYNLMLPIEHWSRNPAVFIPLL